ncbi:MAG: hypothetical protein R3208_18195, partial [Ketobacteraceae bacterium]|nr:hypothetical protein [Ketobacteraceae bacterium]
MSFRFTIDSQVYDLVTSSQSGAVVNQWRVPLRSAHEIRRFVDNLLEQNHHQAGELQRFLVATDQSPKEALIEQIQKGQLLVQKGYVSHPGGAARAPQGVSRHKKSGPQSSIYSDSMLKQMANVDDTGNTSGGNQTQSRQSSTSDGQTSNSGSQNPNQLANTPKSDRQYKICIEIAGRARCYKQRLEINPINGGKQPGERRQTERVRLDHRVPHRSLVAFDGLPNVPRDLTLVIATSGATSDIRLPLVNAHPTSNKSTDKAEWDTVLIPVKPLAYINKERKRQQADLLQPGYVYVFWNNKLWRELEVNR